ncbi:Integrase catalytic core protein [Phytophthora palmivora]|uniref:Integrase catalytic core protein n=1 Tax=Phytophthora palmivora TaxID=4796 RepID=A0A2P4YK34_9STRA|nr:Integrase catalytic core protein [Phytophthora palmivora]
MSRSEWVVDCGASSHMTSVRDKFMSMKDLKTLVRITIADGTKINAVATGTVVEGSLISVSKLAEKNVVAEFSKDKCVLHYGDTMTMEAMRCGNVYELKTVGDKFKIFKAALESATGQRIKRLRSDNGGEYTGRQFKAYLNHCGIKHEKTVPYTPQQNGHAERMNRILVEMARCMLYHESTPYEIVYKTKPQLKNLKVFGTIGWAHIPNEKRLKLDAKAFKCRFMGYEDGVKGDRVMNVTTGKMKMMNQQSVIDKLDNVMDGVVVSFRSTHPMITRSRTRPIDETEDPEEASARKKQIVVSSTTGTTKRQRMIQERAKVNEDQLVIENGQAMAAMEGVPKSYDEATTNVDAKEWKKTIASELESFTANKTWKLKREVIRHKARLVTKGIHNVMALTTKKHEWCDVDTAFLYGKLEEEIYMELPEGLQELLALADTEGEGDVVCLLPQSLYGIKQASRVWNETIDAHLKTMRFKAADANPPVYTRGEDDRECIVCLYVDDMLITSRERDIIASMKAGIAEKFRIKDLGLARFILGIEINCDMERKALTISQRAYTESIINRFGQENAKPSVTPLDRIVHLTKTDEPKSDDVKAKMKSKPYRSLVGSLMYLACGIRPDIAVAVAKLSRYLDNPGQRHWDAGIKVVRYLLKTKGVAITYDGCVGAELTAYSDADWTGNRDDRRSVSGVMLMICGAPVVWRSTFQKTVALSSTEAEYMAHSNCIKEVVWMRRLLEDIGAEQHGPTVIYEDNQGAKALAKNVGYQARTKHIDIRYHFIREKVASGEIKLTYEESKNQLADFLTKGLLTKTLRYLLKQSSVRPKLETSN